MKNLNQAVLFNAGLSFEEVQLVKSAPELLEVLRDAESWLGEFGADSPDTGLTGLVTDIRNAIAKAEGQDDPKAGNIRCFARESPRL